ncbi:hypothetical protein DITRI_Ditri12bG0040700 [Diplodiscus trichospermus]
MVSKVTDASGEAWVSSFNEEAEKIVGCSAEELDKLKSEIIYCFTDEFDVLFLPIRWRALSHQPSWHCHFQEGETNAYKQKLKEATWVPHLFRVNVT